MAGEPFLRIGIVPYLVSILCDQIERAFYSERSEVFVLMCDGRRVVARRVNTARLPDAFAAMETAWNTRSDPSIDEIAAPNGAASPTGPISFADTGTENFHVPVITPSDTPQGDLPPKLEEKPLPPV